MTEHSFAVMAYKDSPYLSACLDSLVVQTVPSRIYITTSTPSPYIEEIAKKYGIELYLTATGLGIAHDWNFSFYKARTKYVTLAHQDDLYMPEYTNTCMQESEKFKDTLICFTESDEMVDGKIRTHTALLHIKNFMLNFFTPLKNDIQTKFFKRRLLSMGNPIAAPSVMYNLDKLADFHFSEEFSINMDWDAWARMADLEGRFIYINKVLLTHRIHPGSATTAGLKANVRQAEDLKMFNRFWPGFLAHPLAKIYAGSYKSNET